MRIGFIFQYIAITGFILSAAGMAGAQNPAPPPVPVKAAPGAVTTETPVADPAIPVKPSQPVVLSFLEWKSLRVHEAQQKLEQINKAQQGQVWQEGKVAEYKAGNGQKLNFNVDVALQLNIQDYFSMYLKTLSVEEFKEATKKLSDEETAELLIAYKSSQEKDKKVPLKFSKNPKDNAKGKNKEI